MRGRALVRIGGILTWRGAGGSVGRAEWLDGGAGLAGKWAMNKILRLGWVGVVAGVLCGSGAWAAAAAPKPDAAAGPFEQLVDDFVFDTLE